MAKSKNPAELVIFGNPKRRRKSVPVPEQHQLKVEKTLAKMPKAIRDVFANPSIPDRWLQGRSLFHERQGKSPREAIRLAVHDWKEQERLEKQFQAEQNPGKAIYRVQLDTGGVSKTLHSKKAADEYLRWLESTGKRGTIVRLNPSKPEELTQAVELYETFQGKRAENIIEAQRSAAMRTDYAALGPLLAIGLYTPDLKIPSPDHWEDYPHLKFGKDVMLASNAGASQLYAIGGDQDVSRVAAQIPDVDLSKDLLDLGPIAFVVYFARKSADNFQPTEYMHQFDTPRPSLVYDQVKREIFFAGGRYTIEERGIDH
jgi:hypothetical protein